MFSSSSSLVDTRNRDKRSLLLGRPPRRNGTFARMDSLESNHTARSPSIEDLKSLEAPKHCKIQERPQMNTPQRKQNGYARKDNGFTTSANSLDSWYQEHMMSGGHGANWPLGTGTGTCSSSRTSSSSSMPAYNWTRQKFDRFDVEPQGGGNYALVERLQAEQSRQRALVEQQLLAPAASELVLQSHIHFAANAAEVGKACTDLLGHVMTTVGNFWPFAAVPAMSASSTPLNPNACSFTPFALNPHAKEFTPKQSCQDEEGQMQGQQRAGQGQQKCSTPVIMLDPPSSDESSSVRTPDNTLSLRPVAERKKTPYVKAHPMSPEVPPSDVSATSLPNGCESKVCDEEEGDEESDGEDEVGGAIIGEDPGFDGPQAIAGKEQRPRLRNQSSCSSDCSFIEFDRGEGNDDRDDDEAEEEEDDEDDSEDDDDDDFDDSDWDDLGEGAGCCVVVDLADFDDLGPSFTCPIIERKNSTSSSLSSSSGIAAAEDITDSACSALNSVKERFYPESDETAEERLKKAERLRKANERWSDAYGENVTGEGCEEEDNRVKFSEPETWAVHLEDPALAADLKEARVSDFVRRQLDKERLSRVISPVLQSKHRKEVYERLYGGDNHSFITTP